MQDEGAALKSEGLLDLQETEPGWMGSKFTPKLFVNFRLDEQVPDTKRSFQLKLFIRINFKITIDIPELNFNQGT